MRLNPAKFDTHLNFIGQKITWRKSYVCPCININSGAAKPNCPQCGGKGRLWDTALPGVVGICGQRVQKEWVQLGQYESGDAVVTFPENTPSYDAGQFDRIMMLNSSDNFSLPLTRGNNDKLYLPVDKITRVFWFDTNNIIVEGGIPSVDSNGVLTWATGEPPSGQQYSINGTRFSEYYVYNAIPSDRNEHQGARLPKKVVLRKFDLFGR